MSIIQTNTKEKHKVAISLDKISKQAPSLLKTAETAVKTIDKASLNGQTAMVAVVLDYSGSIAEEYRSGRMQRLTEKVLALGTQFDDDGDIDFFVFDSNADHLGKIGIGDFEGAVARLTKGRHMGTTDYAKAFRKVHEYFGFGGKVKKLFGFGKKAAAADQPVYVLFLTDGHPDYEDEARKALIETSKSPIFWKFLSIGPRPIQFLQGLDDIPESERSIDNADYQHIGDLNRLSDEAMFGIMLEEFPEWLATVRSKGLIK